MRSITATTLALGLRLTAGFVRGFDRFRFACQRLDSAPVPSGSSWPALGGRPARLSVGNPLAAKHPRPDHGRTLMTAPRPRS